ncbi:MAG: hypothetical protein MPN21_14375 [Thermoanaerobaculia bacterium]|nr:hypothetical protein [Thermoanaerobaculia bacterium]
MSDAWGTVCVPVHEDLETFDLDLVADVSEEFKTKLFSLYGFKPSVLNQRYFQLKNSLLIGRFLCLKVEDIGWAHLCQHIIDKCPDAELYASLYSEYGERFFFASNGRGETFSFRFEDDSDERDQEDFDEDDHETRIRSDENSWLALVDHELKETCPPLLTYLQDRKFEDDDFNWDRYEPERHDGKLAELQESVRELYSSLSTRTLESCAQVVAEMVGKPPTDPKVVESAQGLLEEELDEVLMALEACVGRTPASFFGRWKYGFDLSDDEGLAESLHWELLTLKFAFDEDLGKFLISKR